MQPVASFPLAICNNRIFASVAFVVFLFLLNCSPVRAGVAELVLEETATVDWEGPSEDVIPYWSGETKRIHWRRAPQGTSGIVLSYTTWGILLGFSEEVKPIELISSTRSATSYSIADVYVGGRHVEAKRKDSPMTEKDGPWNRTMAYYAEVIDLDDLVLAKAISVASLKSDLTDDSFSLTSSVQSGSLIDPVVDGRSSTTVAYCYGSGSPRVL